MRVSDDSDDKNGRVRLRRLALGSSSIPTAGTVEKLEEPTTRMRSGGKIIGLIESERILLSVSHIEMLQRPWANRSAKSAEAKASEGAASRAHCSSF